MELELEPELDDERLDPELDSDDERLELKPELLAKAIGAGQPVASAKATSVAATWRRVAFMLLTSLLFKIEPARASPRSLSCRSSPLSCVVFVPPRRHPGRMPCDTRAEKSPLSPRLQC
ncbi:MAG: hypothetical protein IOC34_02190 [Burkholderia sp.]|nr:hypothetical protein [Burkholderia sp.]